MFFIIKILVFYKTIQITFYVVLMSFTLIYRHFGFVTFKKISAAREVFESKFLPNIIRYESFVKYLLTNLVW